MSIKKNTFSCDVCIVGAGITGLTLAYHLQKSGLRVTVLEKAKRPGGAMQTEISDGFLFDQGPSGTFFKSPAVEHLINDLGLQAQVQFANEDAANRYFVKDGALHPLATGPMAFLASNLMSWRGKLRLGMEPFLRAKSENSRESVADFARRRLGQEGLERLIDPLIAGIYAGDPEQLDFQFTLPRLAAMEQKYGSIARALLAMQRARRKKSASEIAKSKMFSFDGGMHVLADSLARQLGDALLLTAEVQLIEQSEHSVEVKYNHSVEGMQVLNARTLVLATPAYASAPLLAPIDAKVSETLMNIDYSKVAVVFHGYEKKQIKHPLDGFGFLVPAIENRKILGSTWSSTKFLNRAPQGYVALKTFIGGERQPELLQNNEDELFNIVESELANLIHVTGQPISRKIRIWPNAIPQFGLQHKAVLETIAAFEAEHHQIRIAGNFLQGVGVSDCIKNAANMASEIIEEHHSGRITQRDESKSSQAFETTATARPALSGN